MSLAKLIGNLVAIIGTALALAMLYDWFARLVGWTPWGFCYVIMPAVRLAGGIGVLFTTVGIITWTVSMFKSDRALGLAIGGVLLYLVPMVMPHYLGAACIQ